MLLHESLLLGKAETLKSLCEDARARKSPGHFLDRA